MNLPIRLATCTASSSSYIEGAPFAQLEINLCGTSYKRYTRDKHAAVNIRHR